MIKPVYREKPLLTNREIQLLSMVGNGVTHRDISEALCIELSTVASTMSHIKEKLEVESNVLAVVKGVERGYLEIV